MRHRLDEIEAFLHVVEAASFSAAARRMKLSKSAISKRISDLEEDMGAELLRRSSRRVVATEQGLRFYQRMRPILEQFDQAAAELNDHSQIRGRLSISAPQCLGTRYLAPLLFAFLARHPQLQLALELEDRHAGFLSEGYDLAVCLGPLPDSSLVARKLALSPRIVCCSPDYARRAGLAGSIECLAGHVCIGQANATAGQPWLFEHDRPAAKPRAVPVRIRVAVNNSQTAMAAAIAGLGLAMLPKYLAVDALRGGELIDAMPVARPISDEIYVVFPHSRYLPRKVRAVVDHLVAAFAEDPPWER
jgi:DNA-binding transcriptional LysR family regulator